MLYFLNEKKWGVLICRSILYEFTQGELGIDGGADDLDFARDLDPNLSRANSGKAGMSLEAVTSRADPGLNF